MINGTMPDANYPRLSFGKSLKQPIGCGHNVLSNLKLSSFNVYRHNFAFVARFDLLPNTGLIEFLPSSGYLFFTVTSLADCHKLASIANYYLSILP
jgi:hypothetical protein